MSRFCITALSLLLAVLATLVISMSASAAIALPTVSSFSPSSTYEGEYGQTVTITGTNFIEANSVQIGGHPASFRIVNNTFIKAEVPASAYTYWIVVTTPGGTAYSKANFVVKPTPTPTITSFTPSSAYVGEIGQTVTITGTYFKGVTTTKKFSGTTAVTIGGQSAKFNLVSETTIKAIVPASAYTHWITVTTAGGTAYSKDNFIIKPVAIPSISSFLPMSSYAGESGRKVTITGQNFKGTGTVNGLFNVTSVLIGGSPASFNVVNDTTIMAVVPDSVLYPIYPISVTNSGGTGYSKDNYTVMSVPAPTITSFSPTYSYTGETGCKVTIKGTNFKGAGSLRGLITTTSVMIGGTSASFKVVNDTSITAVVPVVVAYAAYPITVTTNGGTAYSNGNFVVKPIPAPTILSFTPSSGGVGDTVTINGTDFNGIGAASGNFTGTSMVKIGGTSSSFTVVGDTKITAKVPAYAAYPIYQISVTTSGGTVYSASNFTINTVAPPVITSFSPTKGKAGDVITITGNNFTGTSSVKFSGLAAAAFTVVSATSITATVPDGATTGKIAVTTPGGTATSASNYTVFYTPTITSFSPTSGKVGDSVTITGTNFTGATSVKFNGLSAVTFTDVSATSINAMVPDGATTGKISVTTPGGTATCADDFTVNHPMTQGGSIVVWGDNTFEQVSKPDPNKDYVEVTGGDTFVVALNNNGSVVCWGNNHLGQCNVPVPNHDFSSVSSSSMHSAGLKVDGSIICWGDNNQGDGDVPAPNKDFIAVKAGWVHTVGLKRNGTIIAWGLNTSGQCNVPDPNACYIAVAAGAFHSLALKSDGSVVTWGQNNNGECNVPEPNQDFVAVSAGNSFSAGLKRDGSVVCWGSYGLGVCNVPEPNSNFVAIASGASHVVGLKRDGSLVCWGLNYFNQCNVPEPNSGFIAIGAGDQTSMAIRSNTVVDSSPTISLTNPTLGKAGDVVTIFGSHFTGSTEVRFNGADAYFTVESDICISATIPAYATTGKISVTNTFGTGLSKNDFIICVPPTINSFSPNAGRVGDSVTIYGSGFVDPTIVRFNGIPTVIHGDISSTSITTTVPAGSSTGKITVTTSGGSATSVDVFKVYQPPTIASFSPQRGNVGDQVTIAGTNFTGSTSVEFNGTKVATYTVVNAAFIHATVPDGATTGKISVTTPDGSATSTGDFTVYQPPTITSFSPASGKVGDHITITGTNFTGATVVNFSGPCNAVYTVVSDTSISATVPEGATTGIIYITTPDGMATSAQVFTVVQQQTKSGAIAVWGDAGNGKCDVPSANQDFVSVTGGDMQTSGLKSDGSIVCFGQKHPDMCSVPEPNHDYIAISSRRYLSAAVRINGSVVWWGVDGQPQCTMPEPNTGFTSVGVGWSHAVGLKSDGSIVAWGSNENNQCIVPNDNSNFVAVAAGAFHSLGLKKDGTVLGWGRNEASQCDPPSPNSDYIAVAAGDYHSLGLKSDGSIVCWGGWNVDAIGQCRVPEPNRDFVAIAAGSQHSVGLKRDGSIVCWGLNTDGQCSIPSPNRGFIAIGAGGTTTIAIRALQPISGQMQLGNFVGDVSSQQFTATICSVFDANTSQILKLVPQASGDFTMSTYLQPPYDIRISGSHFLAKKSTNVSVDQSLNVALVNGDADGNNSVDLFDYAVLDAHLDSSDYMADLDGSEQVNLFDYAIIDQNFGAQGD